MEEDLASIIDAGQDMTRGVTHVRIPVLVVATVATVATAATIVFVASPFLLAKTGRAQTPTSESYAASGDSYARQRQFDKAIDAYREALRLNPDNPAAHHGLGMTYYSLGRLAEAIEPLRTAVRLDPQNTFVHLNLGITLAALRRADEAMRELNEAKRLSPDSPRVHNEIGNVLHNSFADLDGALAAYQEARRLDASVPAVHHNIGLMLMRLGRFSEALEPLNEALRLDPTYRNARYQLSHAYSRLGRYEDAVRSWSTFLDLEPNGREALHNRAWNQLYAGGNGAAVAADARRYLQLAGWRDQSSAFMVLIAHLGYRLAGMHADARTVLDDAATRLNTAAWPYPVVRYMRGELDADGLLIAADTNDRKTEARTYMGMDLLLKGRREDARAHFNWVREYGNKRFLEYALAVAELGRSN